MTDKEAMKLALFALDIVKIHYTQSRHVNEAITALKERLADPMREVQRLGQEIEQEPVVYLKPDLSTLNHSRDCRFHDDETYCTCYAEAEHELEFWRSRAITPPAQPAQRTEQEPDDIASIIACRNILDAQPVPPRRTEGKT
jgi:hypothetical protein